MPWSTLWCVPAKSTCGKDNPIPPVPYTGAGKSFSEQWRGGERIGSRRGEKSSSSGYTLSYSHFQGPIWSHWSTWICTYNLAGTGPSTPIELVGAFPQGKGTNVMLRRPPNCKILLWDTVNAALLNCIGAGEFRDNWSNWNVITNSPSASKITERVVRGRGHWKGDKTKAYKITNGVRTNKSFLPLSKH